VNYGPGEVAQAHKQDESAPIGALEDCLRVMREFLA
jgi:acetylornithine deacetylase/succinyl-diaminopimelate desuccinylase-like protein